MAPEYSPADIPALISSLIAHGKTGNLRAVVQVLNQIEKLTKQQKNTPGSQKLLAEAYRHALEPFGVAQKFKEVEQFIEKIENFLQNNSNSEALQETLGEAYSAAIFHYIKNSRKRGIHKNLKKLGEFACNHQNNPFVQLNYARSLSDTAEYFAEEEKEEFDMLIRLLKEMIGIVTFYPGKEILANVAPGLQKAIATAGHCLSLKELEDLATRIDEFINFTTDFEIQQLLTACQGKIFQDIAGKRMREGLRPDGKAPKNKYR
ncbi:MAG: hypothetical protein GF308_11870 [Candidatus Heimdallarchaeota archaeon]|nr:hypothetical protein [Candidatus Heimdallarchaeota archaeon]